MDKLKLSIETLNVETFATHREIPLQGTVKAYACDTAAADCTLGNPCTSDGYATIDVNLCNQSLCSGCDATIGATTCGRTNICCGFSANRTYACCQNSANCG
ncbi:MAG TPA: hypothetical protein VFJ16_24435 [Longimicrobium sp.]|nr:hypothetical protein [Longimicrobium sp.]